MLRLGKLENPGSATLALPSGGALAATDYLFVIPYAAVITDIVYRAAAGSFTLAIVNAGTVVAGLGGLNVNTTSSTPAAATGDATANVSARGECAFRVSNLSTAPAPSGVVVTLFWKRA